MDFHLLNSSQHDIERMELNHPKRFAKRHNEDDKREVRKNIYRFIKNLRKYIKTPQ